MKSALLIASVDATSPPTSTCAVAPNSTPFGLTMNTWPGALMRPKIWLALVSSTRLSVTDDVPGCAKSMRAWLPRSKVCQSIAARCVDCETVSVAPLCLSVAWPATTWPPVGSCVGAGGAPLAANAWPCSPATATPSARSAARRALRRAPPLPWPRAISATATQAPRAAFQTMRKNLLRLACSFMASGARRSGR